MPEENSEPRYPSPFEFFTSPYVLFELNEEGYFTSVNQRGLELTGYTQADIQKGIHISSVVAPEDRERAIHHIQKTMKGENSRGNDYTILHKNGERIASVVFSEPVIRNGQVAGVEGVLLTVDLDHYWESMLVRERRRSRDFLDISGTMILGLDREGKIGLINLTGRQLLGLDEDDCTDEDWFDTFVPDPCREDARKYHRRLVSGEESPRGSFCDRVITRSGETRLIDWRHSVLKDSRGNIFGVLLCGEDVTERKRLERELKESEERLRAMFFESQDAVVLFDYETGEISDCNPEFERQAGRDRESLIGLPSWELLCEVPEDGFGSFKFWREQTGYHEICLKRPDGARTFVEYTVKKLEVHGKAYLLSTGRDITDRRMAVQKATESESKYRTLFDAIDYGITYHDAEGRFIEANPAAYKIFGITGDAVKAALDAVTWFREDGTELGFENAPGMVALRTGKPVSEPVMGFHHPVLHEDRWVTASAIPQFREGETRPYGVCVISADITESRRAEGALRESEERFSKAFHASPQGMMITTVEEGRIIEVNELSARLSGYTREELLGKTVFELRILADPDMFAWIFEEMKNRGRVTNKELVYTTKSGEERIWLFSLEEITLGGMPCYVSVHSDITEQKMMESALRESEEKFSVAFHTNPSMMIITGIDKPEYIEVNESFCQGTGYSREELVGRSTLDIKLWADEAEMNSMFASMSEEGKVRNAEYHFLTKTGEIRTWLCSLDTITIRGERCVIAVAVDITERKEAEAEMELMYETETGLREQLEEEMKRRAEFTRALVHELKTPLTPIVASSEVLAMIASGEPMKGMAENINRGAHNLNKRIDELLELARSELNVLRIEPVVMDLLPLLRQIESEMDSIAASHHQVLSMELPETLGLVRADPGRIRQVVENLLTNAFKYTPDGCKITVSAATGEGEVLVKVQDDGPGISESEAERVFQPYYRKERDRDHLSGLGLGLALCKTIIDLHGGKIWVETRPGKGSRFFFTLPLENQTLND